MLLSQNGSRHKYGHLFSFNRTLECCPDRDLGLAVAYVATEQAIHRAILLHILLDLFNGPHLVASLIIGEHSLEFLLFRCILLKSVTR
ncbi:hypothetical protein D3C81_1252680 [compost metagenome]